MTVPWRRTKITISCILSLLAAACAAVVAFAIRSVLIERNNVNTFQIGFAAFGILLTVVCGLLFSYFAFALFRSIKSSAASE